MLKDGCDVNEAITVAISILEVCLIVGTLKGKLLTILLLLVYLDHIERLRKDDAKEGSEQCAAERRKVNDSQVSSVHVQYMYMYCICTCTALIVAFKPNACTLCFIFFDVSASIKGVVY